MDVNLETLPRDMMRALGFLTRLPIPAKWFEGDDGKLSRHCAAFPIAAALVGAAVGTYSDCRDHSRSARSC